MERELVAWREELRGVTGAKVAPYRLTLFRYYA